MNRIYFMKPIAAIMLSFIAVVTLLASGQGVSQVTGEPTIIGWVDDVNYLERVVGSDGHAIVNSVNVKNGKKSVTTMPKTDFELFQESLPSSIRLSRTNPVSSDYQSAIIVDENDLFLAKRGSKELVRLTNDDATELNARFSPDNNKIAFTKEGDLYIFDLVSNKEKRLTSDAGDKLYNGYAAWVYMEEILGRASNYAAFWWSPDGNKIAFLRTDESMVPVFTLNRLDEADGLHGKLEVVPYPKAGEPTPKVKMGIVDVSTGKITWVKTDYAVDQYIAWPFFTPDSKSLAVQIVNRDQNDLQFILADVETGEYKEIYREKNNTWVEFREDVYVMNNGSGFIVRSYRSGWENLYYYDWTGKLIVQLTDFDFRVNSIDEVDENNKVVYFTATGEVSTDRHYYRVGLDGKNLVQITKGEGSHTITKSPKGNYFIDTWSSVADRGSIVAYDKNGKVVREVYKFVQPEVRSKSEMLTIKTSDGLFDMPAIITYPVNFDPSKRYPVIFKIYGGPDNKNVSNRWQGATPSWYAENGIIIFTVDHRGSGQFGKKGLDYLYRNLGKWEISDYSDAVKWLTAQTYVDKNKIGITGTSYGGYMTCMALTKGADYWTHGFAGSSVTDWRLYDNVYTERFMDTPQNNKEGYDAGSSLMYVDDLKGKFYLNHGDLDDNVHMQNSIWLISKLEDSGKEFKFMLYPNGRHGWSGAKRTHSSNEEKNFWIDGFFK